LEAAQRREERESKKRQKEFERQLKSAAKWSALEQAQLEVGANQGAIEVLLSMHKEEPDKWDWGALAYALPPHRPTNLSTQEMKALVAWVDEASKEKAAALISGARSADESEHASDLQQYAYELSVWESRGSLARRILAGDLAAYTQAVEEFSNLGEVSQLGSSFSFKIHSPKLIECTLKVNGRDAIPSETKSLTATGKLSIKPMSKARFQEVYQDYVCSGVLRVAREVFALLPAEMAIITATVESDVGPESGVPIISVALSRAGVERLDYERLDPSDTLETFLYRGEVKAGRKAGTFVRIEPLTINEVMPQAKPTPNVFELLRSARELREQLVQSTRSTTTTEEPESENDATE